MPPKKRIIMKHRILFLLLLAAGLLPAVADNITVDGTQRSYIVYVPNNLEANRPLFIFCHGSGQDANYMLNTQFRDTQNPERKISIEAVNCQTPFGCLHRQRQEVICEVNHLL